LDRKKVQLLHIESRDWEALKTCPIIAIQRSVNPFPFPFPTWRTRAIFKGENFTLPRTSTHERANEKEEENEKAPGKSGGQIDRQTDRQRDPFENTRAETNFKLSHKAVAARAVHPGLAAMRKKS
jgi:hypothetical protein